MDRFHGKAAKLGMEDSPRCADCHAPHAPLPAENPESKVHPDNLVETCGACHEDANENFVQFDPHPDPNDPERSAFVHYTYLFMQLLIAGVFGFFGLHTTAWLQRTIGAYLRDEIPPVHTNEKWVKRFSGIERTLHIFVNISFILLAMTGLPMLFSEQPGAQFLAYLMGGQPTMRYIHFLCAGITFGYFTVHLAFLFIKFLISADFRKRMFWGVDSMVPNLKDLQDLVGMTKWFLYMSPPPKLERWTYWEKFDYWAVFWGIGMIGVSGLLLSMPEFFSRVLPGEAINVAAVIHGEEALLAVGFIFVFHFFHNHLRPENFPIDISIYTGRIPLERFKHERSDQYNRMVEEGTLDDLIVGPPSRATTFLATLFGSSIVIIGLVLIVVVFWTVLTTGAPQ
jgi:cytochrome b subunit of formate dehydrogenase